MREYRSEARRHGGREGGGRLGERERGRNGGGKRDGEAFFN